MTVCGPALPDTTLTEAAAAPIREKKRRLARLGGSRTAAMPQGRTYSHLVGALKLLLPGAALLIVIIIGLWQNLFGDGNTAILQQVDGSMVGDRLLSPRFVGTDAQDRPFSLEADYADQLSGDGSVVSFSEPRGELLVDDGFIDLTARSGQFDRQAEHLLLEGDVGVRRSDGVVFNTETLHVDLTADHAWSDVPVQGSGNFGQIEAEGGIDILDAGATVRFKGPARLVLNPDDMKGLP